MYLDFHTKEIPSSAIRAVGSTMGSGGFIGATQQQVNSYRSEWEQWDEECGMRACPMIALPYNCPEGSTIRFTGAPPTGCCDHPAYTCDSASYYPQSTEPSGGGSPQSDPNIPTPCKPVLGSTNPYARNMNEIIGYDCSGSGSSNPQVTSPYVPIIGEPIFVPQESWDQDEPEMLPDDVTDFDTSSNPCAGVRCIKVYKPCPEGYIDGNECCPNTGNCVPDPNYVAYGGLIQMQPISETAPVNFVGDPTTYRSGVMADSPASQFDQTTPAAIALQDYRTQFEQAVQSGTASLTPPESQYTLLGTPVTSPISSDGEEFQLDGVAAVLGLNEMNQPIRMEIPVRSSTPLPFERTTTAPTTATSTTTAPTTSTTETSTAEEPKQGGLGILVLGLIALEALAT